MVEQEILEKVEKFFESEYQKTKELLDNPPFWVMSEKAVVNNAIQRCFGVVQFIQYLDISYISLDIYNIYREHLEKLLDK